MRDHGSRTSSPEKAKEGIDFLPLNLQLPGKILRSRPHSRGYFKAEGRPSNARPWFRP